VAEGLDLGPSFDPEDGTDHRYQYVISDNPVSIMPTLDYYGFEHEDAITGTEALHGLIREGSAFCGFDNSWGGVRQHVMTAQDFPKIAFASLPLLPYAAFQLSLYICCLNRSCLLHSDPLLPQALLPSTQRSRSTVTAGEACRLT
jgi:hypothetical protein